MSHATIERVESFLRTPSIEEYNSLRELVLADEDYESSSLPVLLLERRLAFDDPLELLEAIDQLSWVWQLCPRLHFVTARLYERLDSEAAMERCITRMQNCLKMLLETGDGSPRAPFRVTFTSDQRDILWALGAELRQQELVHEDERWIDVVTVNSGEIRFDVTDVLMRSGMFQDQLSDSVTL